MKMGCSESDSKVIADVFMAAEKRGIPSHGMIRIRDYYELWKDGISLVPVISEDLVVISKEPGIDFTKKVPNP